MRPALRQPASLQVLTLINEPTAAAMSYGLNADEEQTILVYDFGGGTLDVTILRIHHGIFEEISSKGVGKLGGDDIDLLLAQHLAERFQQDGLPQSEFPLQQFQRAVEEGRKLVSSEPFVVARRAALVPERHLNLEEEIDRSSFERACSCRWW